LSPWRVVSPSQLPTPSQTVVDHDHIREQRPRVNRSPSSTRDRQALSLFSVDPTTGRIDGIVVGHLGVAWVLPLEIVVGRVSSCADSSQAYGLNPQASSPLLRRRKVLHSTHRNEGSAQWGVTAVRAEMRVLQKQHFTGEAGGNLPRTLCPGSWKNSWISHSQPVRTCPTTPCSARWENALEIPARAHPPNSRANE
jgi:hypothetical protein